MNMQTAIEEITKAVMQDRQKTYGPPEDSFGLIAALWTSYLGAHVDGPLHPHDVAAMMMLLKIGRIAYAPHNIDSWIDAGGYAICGAELSPPPEQPDLPMSTSCSPAKRELSHDEVQEAYSLGVKLHDKINTLADQTLIDRALLRPDTLKFSELNSLRNRAKLTPSPEQPVMPSHPASTSCSPAKMGRPDDETISEEMALRAGCKAHRMSNQKLSSANPEDQQLIRQARLKPLSLNFEQYNRIINFYC